MMQSNKMRVVRASTIAVILGGLMSSSLWAGAVTFTPVGPTAVDAGTDIVMTLSVTSVSLASFDAADIIIGSTDAADIAFVYDTAWTSAFSNVTTPAFDVGFYSQDVFVGGNNAASVGSTLVLGTITIDTTGMSGGSHQVVVDNATDGFSRLALAGMTEPLTGAGIFQINGVACSSPIVSAAGSRFISITPQPADSTDPTRFFITSSTWPCVAKFVGVPAPLDLDANGTIDGMGASLVDLIDDAGLLGAQAWSGSACDNLMPFCTTNAQCAVGQLCVPIMRCSESLEPCTTTPNCPVGQTCIPGKLYIAGAAIAPSERNLPPTEYFVQADCGGGQTPPQSVIMKIIGDADGSGIVSATDITLTVLGFQLFYHRPLGDPNGSLSVSVDQRGTNNICGTISPPIVNVADITAVVKSFQLSTYAAEAANNGCTLPCP